MGLRRKVAVKYKPTTIEVKVDVSRLRGGWHYHSCVDRDCRRVFADVCITPEVNGQCPLCRHGEETPEMAWRAPRDCCWGNCELVGTTSDWFKWLPLAGPGPWFKCRTCHRPHGAPLA